MSQMKFDALESRFRTEMLEAKAILELYLNSSVGVGEHPQVLLEMERQIAKYSEAEGKLQSLYSMVKPEEEGEE